jgi:hypothetical protein
MNDISKLTLEELRTRHKAVYDAFTPTLKQYSEMASECLLIQIELFKKTLRAEFPDAPLSELAPVIKLTAREMLPVLEATIKEIKERKIEPAAIIYDPLTFTFNLYAKTK